MTNVEVFAPGRVNLIGDHTDYAGGLALPCAIDLGLTISGHRNHGQIELRSQAMGGVTHLDLGASTDLDSLEPRWGRYVAAVAQELGSTDGFVGEIGSNLPAGAGLSSSAALEIALALALGFSGSPMDLALLGQRAELRAVGVPCGLLDQLSIVFAQAGHAMVIDFADDTIDQVTFPDDLDIWIVHSGQERHLADSAYAARRTSCEVAADRIGPLSRASAGEIGTLDGELLRRARHVSTECERVRQAALALQSKDPIAMGQLMLESHASLRDDFDVSTPVLDGLVERLATTPGVFGARLTGAGFGGCVVALCERGAVADPNALSGRGWIVHPSDGARRRDG